MCGRLLLLSQVNISRGPVILRRCSSTSMATSNLSSLLVQQVLCVNQTLLCVTSLSRASHRPVSHILKTSSVREARRWEHTKDKLADFHPEHDQWQVDLPDGLGLVPPLRLIKVAHSATLVHIGLRIILSHVSDKKKGRFQA